MVALASGACTDEWLQDQLVIFMALAQVRRGGSAREQSAGVCRALCAWLPCGADVLAV